MSAGAPARPTAAAAHPTESSALRRWWPVLLAGSIVLLGAALTLYRIGAKSVWYDEALSIYYATADLGTVVARILGRDTNGALYLAILRGWVAVVGDGEGAVRLLSAIFAVASLPLVYGIGQRLAGRVVGFAGGLLLATSFMFVAYGQEARMYTLAILLTTASTGLLIVAADRRRRSLYVAYGLLAGLSIGAHLFAALVLLAQFVWLASQWRRGDRGVALADIVVAAIPAGLMAAPWAYFIATTPGPTWIPAMTLTTLGNVFTGLAGSSLALLVATVIASGLGVYRWWRERRSIPAGRPDVAALVVLWALLPIVAGIAISVVRTMMVTRYFIVAVPGLCLLAAYGTLGIPRRDIAWLAFVAVLALNVATLVTWYGGNPKDDWRATVQHVAESAGPEDLVMLYLPQQQLAYDYYVRRFGLEGEMPDVVPTVDPAAIAGHPPPNIWMILNYQWTGVTPADLQARFDELSAAGYRNTGKDVDLGGIKVRHFIPKESSATAPARLAAAPTP